MLLVIKNSLFLRHGDDVFESQKDNFMSSRLAITNLQNR